MSSHQSQQLATGVTAGTGDCDTGSHMHDYASWRNFMQKGSGGEVARHRLLAGKQVAIRLPRPHAVHVGIDELQGRNLLLRLAPVEDFAWITTSPGSATRTP
jgi:hypothetical protein